MQEINGFRKLFKLHENMKDKAEQKEKHTKASINTDKILTKSFQNFEFKFRSIGQPNYLYYVTVDSAKTRLRKRSNCGIHSRIIFNMFSRLEKLFFTEVIYNMPD